MSGLAELGQLAGQSTRYRRIRSRGTPLSEKKRPNHPVSPRPYAKLPPQAPKRPKTEPTPVDVVRAIERDKAIRERFSAPRASIATPSTQDLPVPPPIDLSAPPDTPELSVQRAQKPHEKPSLAPLHATVASQVSPLQYTSAGTGAAPMTASAATTTAGPEPSPLTSPSALSLPPAIEELIVSATQRRAQQEERPTVGSVVRLAREARDKAVRLSEQASRLRNQAGAESIFAARVLAMAERAEEEAEYWDHTAQNALNEAEMRFVAGGGVLQDIAAPPSPPQPVLPSPVQWKSPSPRKNWAGGRPIVRATGGSGFV